MRFKIEGATPENVAALLRGMLEQNGLTMDVVNVYVNYTRDGHPVVPITDEGEEIRDLQASLNPEKVWKPGNIKLNFITKTELVVKQRQRAEERERRSAEYRAALEKEAAERYRLSQIGWLGIGRRLSDGLCKFYKVHEQPDEVYIQKKKEKYGYQVLAFVPSNNLDTLESRIKEHWRTEGKEDKGYYHLTDEDVEYFKFQGTLEK